MIPAGLSFTVFYSDRRNLTDADILRCVTALDKRNTHGGDRKSQEIKASNDVLIGPSRDKTAELVGTSPFKVQKVRAVLDHAQPETLAAVEQGGMSINKAYTETQQHRKEEAEAKEMSSLELISGPSAKHHKTP